MRIFFYFRMGKWELRVIRDDFETLSTFGYIKYQSIPGRGIYNSYKTN